MKSLQEYVKSLDDNTLLTLIEDYEKLEKDGSIGDCVLREVVSESQSHFGATSASFSIWASMVFMEALRVFAKRYFKEHEFFGQ